MHSSLERQIERLEGTEKADDTIREYRRALKEYSQWVEEHHIDPEEANPLIIEDFLAYLNNTKELSSSSIRIKYAALGYYYGNLKKGNVIQEDPTDDADVGAYAPLETEREKATNEKRIYFEKEEVQQLVRNVPAPRLRNRLLVLFQYYTALRRQEVADVKISDLNREKRQVKVRGKGDTTHTAHWQPKLDPLLTKYIENGYRDESPYAEESEYLFVTPKTPKIDGQTINDVVVRAAENAGIQKMLYVDARGAEHNKYTSHTLRHSFAMHWLENGGSMEGLSKHLAHSTITTTEIYGEILDERADEEYQEFAPQLSEDISLDDDVCSVCNTRACAATHHLSYEPERTIEVCTSCHAEIHGTDKYKELKPDMTRQEAIERGLLD